MSDNDSTHDAPDEWPLERDAIELPDIVEEEEASDALELEEPSDAEMEADDFGALSDHYDEEVEEPSLSLDLSLDDAISMADEIIEVEAVDDERIDTEVSPRESELEESISLDRPVVLSDNFPEESLPEEEIEDDEGYFEDEVEEPLDEVVTEAETISIEYSRTLWLLYPLVFLGIVARVAWYWKNRAFSLDEADVTSELLSRSIPELFQVLGEHQCAPIGYLLTVKMATLMFGSGEYALRLYPLLATILALLFFAVVARRMLEPLAAVLATSIVAVSWPVVHYAAEFKQYGNDVMTSALMLLLGYTFLFRPMSKRQLLLLALVGALVQWYSLPVLFVLAGVGLTLGVEAVLSREWGKVRGLLLVALAWLASFGANYFISLQHYAREEALRTMHYESYCLLPPARAWSTVIRWAGETSLTLFSDPLGLVLPGLGMLCFVLGGLHLARTQRAALSMIMLPILGVLLAGMAQRYPLHGRFLQFLVPGLTLCCAVGLSGLLQLLWTFRRKASVFLGVLFFLPSVAILANHLLKPVDQGMRPVVGYWQDHRVSEDLTYVDHWVRNEFDYYSRDDLEASSDQVRVGISRRNDWSEYESIVQEYVGHERVWFMLQAHEWHLSPGEQQFFETRLSDLGKQLDHQIWGDYHLYLYDLSVPSEEVDLPEEDVEDPLANEEPTLGLGSGLIDP